MNEREAMKNPEEKKCIECWHWERCSALFIGPEGADNTSCDFSPSRWRPRLHPVEVTAEDLNDLVSEGLVSIQDAAKFLAVSRSRIITLMDEKKLPYAKIGKSVRIPLKGLKMLVSANLKGGKGAK